MRARNFSLLLIILTFPFAVQGASIRGDDAIIISVSPEFPGPGESVTITASGRSFDSNQAVFIWSVGGKEVLRGPAEKNYMLETSRSGAAAYISLSVASAEGARYQKSITVTPSLIDLLWEARVYTPPFYRGHSLATSESIVTVVALPELTTAGGTRIAPSKLIYKWSKDGKNIGSASGLGKQSLAFTSAKLFNENHITVTVSSSDGTISASRSMGIPVSDPRVVLYPAPALLGTLYNKALGTSFSLLSDETGVRAAAYYFSLATDGTNPTTLMWSLNGKLLPTEPEGNSLVTLRKESAAGTARISVTATHPSNLLQSATWSGSVNLGNSASQF